MLGDAGNPDPDHYPHIERVDDGSSGLPMMSSETMYRCTQYGGKFDREAYELAGGQCPVCADVGDAQRGRRGGL